MSSSIAKHTLPWQFTIGWFVLLTLHALCLGYYIGVALIYTKLLPLSTLEFQFRAFSIGIATTEYSKIALVHAVMAAIHACFMLLTIMGSIQAKRFVFYPNWRPLWNSFKVTIRPLCSRSPTSKAVTRSACRSSLSSFSRNVSGKLSQTGSALFSKDGLLGVDSVYFDHLLLVREILETSLQTYQAYRMTCLLPRLWLIRIYVVMLVANCWIVPILHRVYLKRDRMRRLMSLVCDAVLDLVSSIGISFFIFAMYVPQYTDPLDGFPFSNWYNDQWFISVYQEFQMMVIMSWSDMASRLVFAFGVLQAMDSIKELLDDTFGQEALKNHLTRQNGSIIAVGPSISISTTVKPRSEKKPRRDHIVHALLHVVGPVCFVLWGFIILVIHIYAETRFNNSPCTLPLRPWLHTHPACSLVEINCTALTTDWTTFEPTLAAGLVIRHCPELTIPHSIQTFTDLITMKTYNSSITSWPATASLTTAHQRIRALYLIRTNVTNGILPPGLTQQNFPPTLGAFLASVTNLHALPVNLHTCWPAGMVLSIEFAGLTSVPDAIMPLNPTVLSLAHNPITSLPPELFEIPMLGNLLLANTAIQELPRHVPHLSTNLYALILDNTNVSTLWSWMDPFIARSSLYFAGFIAASTPLCYEQAEIRNGTRHEYSASATETDLSEVMDVSTPSQLAFSIAAVWCESIVTMEFPLDQEDIRNQDPVKIE